MNQLKIVPIGGLGKVTQNMYLYEYADEMLMAALVSRTSICRGSIR